MIDVSVARQAYEQSDIDHIGWIQPHANIANGLTKPGICKTLDLFLRDHTLSTDIRTVINGKFESIPLSSAEFNPPKEKTPECENETKDTSYNSVKVSDNDIYWVIPCMVSYYLNNEFLL